MSKNPSASDVVYLTCHRCRVGTAVPADVAQRLNKLEDAYWSRRAREALEEMAAAGEYPIPLAEIYRDLA